MKPLSVKTSKITIEAMRPEHWNQVEQVYLEGIATGQATFETRAPSWEAWDDSHLPWARLVAHCGNQIVGWAALSPVSRRQAYTGVAEVSIYVASNHRNQGVGQTANCRIRPKWDLDAPGRCFCRERGDFGAPSRLWLSRRRAARTNWKVEWNLARHDIAGASQLFRRDRLV